MARQDEDDEDRREREKFLKVTHDAMNEAVVLAAAAAGALDRIAKLGALPEHFVDPRHAAIWRAMLELRRRKMGYEAAALLTIDSRVDVAYVGKLEEARPDVPANLEAHVRSLFWDSKRAQIANGPLDAMLAAFRDGKATPEEVFSNAMKVAEACRGHGAGDYLVGAKAVAAELAVELRRRREGQAVFPFGVRDLDEFEDGNPERKAGERWRIYPGAEEGLITTITGISGMGKSLLVANMVLGMVRQGRRVLWGTWEEKPRDGVELISCMSLGLSRRKLRIEGASEEVITEIEARAAVVDGHLSFLRLPFGRRVGEKSSNEKNLDVVHQQVASSGADVAFFDIFNRVLVDRRPESEEAAFFRLSGMAIETGCHVVNTHQQRLGDVAKRDDFRPTAEGIKGSKAAIEASDYVFGVHDPNFFKPVVRQVMEVHALKVKKGPCPWAVSFEVDKDRGIIGRGKTIPYDATPGKGRRRKAEDDFGDIGD